MSRMPSDPLPRPEIPPDLLEWVRSQNFSPLGTMGKQETVDWLMADHNFEVSVHAVNRAISTGELASTYISGQTRVSQRDAILWALSRRRENGPRNSRFSHPGGPGRKPQAKRSA